MVTFAVSRRLAWPAVIGALIAPVAIANPATQEWQSVDALTQNVARALGREAAPIDRRIKLARCPETPVVTAMDSNSLAVRCTPLGWRLRVGMSAGGAAAQTTDYFAPAAPPAHRERTAPALIKRGDTVRVSIDRPNYSVSYPATATQEGRLGDSIALRGADPKSLIVAVITGPGRAVIGD